MIIADIGRGAMYASMAFLHELWAIFLLSFAIECLSLLWIPARDASLPNIVPRRQLANANSIGLVSTYATLPLGGAIFAVLAEFSKAVRCSGRIRRRCPLLLDAGTFAFSAFMVSGVPIPPPSGRALGGFDLSRVWHDMVDGVRFLREDSIAAAMTAGIVMAFAAVGAVLALGSDLRDVHARGRAGRLGRRGGGVRGGHGHRHGGHQPGREVRRPRA